MASPGASTAVHAMLDVMQKCFPEKFESEWKAEVLKHIPAYGTGVNHDAALAAETLQATGETLGLIASNDATQTVEADAITA